MFMQALAFVCSFALALPATAGAATPAAYTITGIGTLPGYTMSAAVAINNYGLAVGQVCCGNWPAVPQTQAVTFRGGVLSGLDGVTGGIPGFYSNAATAVNNRGLIVGWTYYISGSATCNVDIAIAFGSKGIRQYGLLGGCPQFTANGVNDRGEAVGNGYSQEFEIYDDAVLFHGTNVVVLGTGTANAINDSGLVVGTDGSGIATLFTRKSAREIGTLGGTWSAGAAINDAGVVAGSSALVTAALQHAFIYANGQLVDLGVPAGTDPNVTSSSALAINNHNVVVGAYTLSNGVSRAFVDANGVMLDLTSMLPKNSGWTLTTAAGINDCGEIVGTGTHAGGTFGYVLHPRANPLLAHACR